MEDRYDVIVAGGGTAGVVAAIQSARAGARTLLIEKNAMLGGTMTVGGINAPAHFCAWGQQIISGIGWELMCRTWDETGRPAPTPEYTAGTMAALSIETGLDPEDLPMDRLYSLLHDHGAIVPGDVVLP